MSFTELYEVTKGFNFNPDITSKMPKIPGYILALYGEDQDRSYPQRSPNCLLATFSPNKPKDTHIFPAHTELLHTCPPLSKLISSISHLKPIPGPRKNQLYLPCVRFPLPCPGALIYVIHYIYHRDDFSLIKEICPFDRPDVLRWEIIQQMYQAESERDIKEASRRLAFWFRSYPPECIDKGKRWEFRTRLTGTVANLNTMGFYNENLANLSSGISKALELVDGQSSSSGSLEVSSSRCVPCPTPLTGYGYAY